MGKMLQYQLVRLIIRGWLRTFQLVRPSSRDRFLILLYSMISLLVLVTILRIPFGFVLSSVLQNWSGLKVIL